MEDCNYLLWSKRQLEKRQENLTIERNKIDVELLNIISKLRLIEEKGCNNKINKQLMLPISQKAPIYNTSMGLDFIPSAPPTLQKLPMLTPIEQQLDVDPILAATR